MYESNPFMLSAGPSLWPIGHSEWNPHLQRWQDAENIKKQVQKKSNKHLNVPYVHSFDPVEAMERACSIAIPLKTTVSHFKNMPTYWIWKWPSFTLNVTLRCGGLFEWWCSDDVKARQCRNCKHSFTGSRARSHGHFTVIVRIIKIWHIRYITYLENLYFPPVYPEHRMSWSQVERQQRAQTPRHVASRRCLLP